MNPLLDVTDLNIAHVQIILRGMYAVALTEGVHDTELVMLKDFYDQCAVETEALASFRDVVDTPFDAETAVSVLNSDALKQTFIVSCIFLAYADGKYSEKERQKIRELCNAIDVSQDQLAEIENLAADQLMAQFAHIENLEALKEVSNEIRAGAEKSG